MNISYSHKYQDPIAKMSATSQNLKHMMYLFWWDNTPNHVRENRDMRDYTQDVITEFVSALPAGRFWDGATQISDFLSVLVEDAQEHYDEIRDQCGVA